MRAMTCVLGRELRGYFATPVAYVFIVIFLFLSGMFTFQIGNFWDFRQASLERFFIWHPWLYLFLIPAVSMRLWSEERRSGTIELLLTLPVRPLDAILGKFLAAWAFIAIALALTFPMIWTVFYLGEPDLGVIIGGYFGSLLMAGAYLAIGICMSALSKNQVISFILAVVVCFLLLLAGFGPVLSFFQGWAPDWLVEAVASVSFLTHFEGITRGQVTLNTLVFFCSLIVGWLVACNVLIEMKKAE